MGKRTVICMLLFAVVSGAVRGAPAYAATSSISLSPSSLTVHPGDMFDIIVTLDAGVELRGGQCSLSFDPALVQCENVTEGNFFKDWAEANGCSTMVFPKPVTDNNTGTVSDIGIVILGVAEGGRSGSDTFCTYRMSARTEVSGTATLRLSNVFLTDADGNTITDFVVNNGEIIVSSSIPATPSTPASSTTPATTAMTSTTPTTPITSTTPRTSTTPAASTTLSSSTTPAADRSRVDIIPLEQSGTSLVMLDLSGIIDSSGLVQVNAEREGISFGETGWKARLEIKSGTRALTEDARPLKRIVLRTDPEPPPPPPGDIIIGSAVDLGPDGATFSPPVSVTFLYEPDSLPEGVRAGELLLAYFDEETREWFRCDSSVDTAGHSITAQLSHFTTFAVLAEESGQGVSLAVIIIISELVVAVIVVSFLFLRRRAPVMSYVPARTYDMTAIRAAREVQPGGPSQPSTAPDIPPNTGLKTRMEMNDGKFVFTREDGLPSIVEIVNLSGCEVNVSVEYDAAHPDGVTKITMRDRPARGQVPGEKTGGRRYLRRFQGGA